MSFYSDGLVEAHDPHQEMFGTPRIRSLLVQHPAGTSGITTFFLEDLERFTDENREQEDDITLVALSRSTVRGGG
jgi:serine phosphatase RsbU (regulator of sigma subunit)